MKIPFYDKNSELMDRELLERMQLDKIRLLVNRALQTPFYKKILTDAGLEKGDDIRDFNDFRKIPFTTKDDLRKAFPYGMLAVRKRDIIRLHASSGTTGIPTVIYHSRNDIDNWTDLTARSLAATGCTKNDVLQNMMSYGLFTGGLGVHYAAEQLGMLVIPASAGNTQKQLRLMKDFGTTVVHATPSYLLHIFSRLDELELKLADLNLKKALLGAEPHSEDTRKRIESLFCIEAYNSYGLSEMNGPGVAFECIFKKGMHLWEDAFYMEIINPDTLEPAGEGEPGELVLSTLNREGTPVLRYRTRDLTFVIPGVCDCGRVHRRIGRIIGRTDDMLIINGVNVFPSQVEEVIMRMPEIGTNYQIVLEKEGSLDRLIIRTEVLQEFFNDSTGELNQLCNRIAENLKASILISPKVELHEPGVLPVYEGKAVRVIDNREKI